MNRTLLATAVGLTCTWAACAGSSGPRPCDDVAPGQSGIDAGTWKRVPYPQASWFTPVPIPSSIRTYPDDGATGWSWPPRPETARPPRGGEVQVDGTAYLTQVLGESGVDYAELRYGEHSQAVGGWRCARAKQPVECERAFAGLRAPASTPLSDLVDTALWQVAKPQVSTAAFLIVERAGVFSRLSTKAQMLALLGGTIDTLPKAVLYARLHGFRGNGYSYGWEHDRQWILEATTRHEVEPPPEGSTGHKHLIRIDRSGALVVDFTERQ